MPPRQAAEAIASARTAALLDPEGEALAKCLADIEAQAESQDRRRIREAAEEAADWMTDQFAGFPLLAKRLSRPLKGPEA